MLILSKATVLLKSTQNLIPPCQTWELRLSSWSTKNNTEFLNIHQSKGFQESNLFLPFCRNSHCLSVLSYMAPLNPYSLFLSYILKIKSFTSSGKKRNDRLHSELLDNCFCTFLYEGHLVNDKISLSFGAQLASGCIISHVSEGEIWSRTLE